MDENAPIPEDGGNSEDMLKQFLESFLGSTGADEAAEAMRARGFDLSALSNLPGMNTPGAMAQAMGQMRFLMNSSTDPVNWRMVEEVSRQNAYQAGDPRLGAAEAQSVRQALSVADLWLDPATSMVAPGIPREAWTRVEWFDQTLPEWQEICNPIAENASRAMADAMSSQLDAGDHGMPDGMAGLAQSLSAAMPKMGAMAFAAQIGQALSEMAKEALGSSDAGLPLTESPVTALVPTNVAAFAEGLDVPYEEIVQFVAARECAHARLFASVPWLRHDLHIAIMKYAREITLDEDAIEEAARSIDPSNPESLEAAMSSGVFSNEPTEDQARAQERLETLLALIEGWVEVVSSDAVAPYLPQASKLAEMMRRRRVTGSNAERLLRQLVGLDLRPRQTRGAAKIFRMVTERSGADARDALWSHPDRVPTAAQLADPDSFFEEPESDPELSDLDAQLSALLDGTLGFDEGVPEDQRGTNEKGGEGGS